MSAHLFTYGTLELPEVFTAVTGQVAHGVPARLPGYVRYRLRGEVYPGIIPSGKDSLDGTLYFDLEPLLHKKIDHYEDTCYEKQEVEVVTEAGETVIAMAYVIPENKRLLLSSIPWDQQQFIQEHMDNFLRYIR
ncbi:MAG: gamma-glutamylcyclotransferase [Thiohalophilus sp.]|jgi:gamma-glutamylcyclotransferase (GGCT)/AIG2-like uncharacterized protein YtfP